MWKQCGSLSRTVYSAAMECLGSEDIDWFDENHAEIMNLIGKKVCCPSGGPPWASRKMLMKSKVTQKRITWKKLLQQSEGGLCSHQCRLISASECRWNQAHIREEQDPGEVGWVFWWCIKQAIFYQRQGHWMITASLDVTSTLNEVQIAIHQLSSSKAPGSDAIPVEIYKLVGCLGFMAYQPL